MYIFNLLNKTRLCPTWPPQQRLRGLCQTLRHRAAHPGLSRAGLVPHTLRTCLPSFDHFLMILSESLRQRELSDPAQVPEEPPVPPSPKSFPKERAHPQNAGNRTSHFKATPKTPLSPRAELTCPKKSRKGHQNEVLRCQSS